MPRWDATTAGFSNAALDDFIKWLERGQELPDGICVAENGLPVKTRGSGNQDHSPGDLKFTLVCPSTGNGGHYLLEHKATEKKQRSFSFKELMKLRQEAHSVGRIPAFGVSFYDAATGRFTHLITFF